MDAFEHVVGRLFEREGYWVRHNYKVKLDPQENRQLGKPSAPAWDLDLIAYKGSNNQLFVVECKGFLDTPGVKYEPILRRDHQWSKKFLLFNRNDLRRKIFKRLRGELVRCGACACRPKISLCLAAGRIQSKGRSSLRRYFKKRGWTLHEEEWILKGLRELAAPASFDNDVAVVVMKLLRNERQPGSQAGRSAARSIQTAGGGLGQQ